MWLGKLDRDDSHILGTSSGAIAVRSVRRLPPESQADSKMLEHMKGLPWQPRDGVRHRVTPEVSHAVPMPLPPATAAGSPRKVMEFQSRTKTRRRERNILLWQLMEQIWTSTLSLSKQQPNWKNNLVHLTMRPSFLRATPRSHQLNLNHHHLHHLSVEQDGVQPGQNLPQGQSQELVTCQHLEIWEAIQKWGDSEEKSNPTAIQTISNVADYVDQILDPDKVHPRKAQLKKLWERQALTPIHKGDVPKDPQVCGHKWVDKNSKGVYKSRFTCAEIKARYTPERESDLDVFVPTPTPESHAILEVSALVNGYYTRSLDIVAAFLIGKDQGNGCHYAQDGSFGLPVFGATVEGDVFHAFLQKAEVHKWRSFQDRCEMRDWQGDVGRLPFDRWPVVFFDGGATRGSIFV